MSEKKKYESQRLATNKWNRENTKCFTTKLYLKNDQDIIAHLETVENRNAYIKQLIRQDIQKKGRERAGLI